MKIFISWSEQRSRHIASALKSWLPDVFQGDEIFMSEHDIEAGARWGNRLNNELEKSSFGIVCLTPENLNAPWVLYEVGALSKAINESRVVPYLLELKPTDFSGPLAQFQSVLADQNGTLKLLQSINNVRENKLTTGQLSKVFSKWWGDLEHEINKTPSIFEDKPQQRSELSLLEEILQLVRSQSNIQKYDFNIFEEKGFMDFFSRDVKSLTIEELKEFIDIGSAVYKGSTNVRERIYLEKRINNIEDELITRKTASMPMDSTNIS